MPYNIPVDQFSRYLPVYEESDEIFRIEEPAPSSKEAVMKDMLKAISTAATTYKGNERHEVRKIGSDLHSYYNSVNPLTGAQGGGKTFAALAECLSICRQTNNTNLLIFIRKKSFDPTIESIKSLIEQEDCAVKEIEYEDAMNYVNYIFNFKKLYNAIRRAMDTKTPIDIPREFLNTEFGQTEEQARELLTDSDLEELVPIMLRELNVSGFDSPWLNTLIIFDDASGSKLFKNTDSYFSNQLRLARDNNSVWFITVHALTSISPIIKQNCACIYLQGFES
jgi:hypothetical protein